MKNGLFSLFRTFYGLSILFIYFDISLNQIFTSLQYKLTLIDVERKYVNQ